MERTYKGTASDHAKSIVGPAVDRAIAAGVIPPCDFSIDTKDEKTLVRCVFDDHTAQFPPSLVSLFQPEDLPEPIIAKRKVNCHE